MGMGCSLIVVHNLRSMCDYGEADLLKRLGARKGRAVIRCGSVTMTVSAIRGGVGLRLVSDDGSMTFEHKFETRAPLDCAADYREIPWAKVPMKNVRAAAVRVAARLAHLFAAGQLVRAVDVEVRREIGPSGNVDVTSVAEWRSDSVSSSAEYGPWVQQQQVHALSVRPKKVHVQTRGKPRWATDYVQLEADILRVKNDGFAFAFAPAIQTR
ncbi:hypothetical protein JKP88DRAFT_241258 [Tribonema minus]|uniref:Uncharacterized protein n=1 Tax=Tribonema minus TaxID=303371 RepID=A0A835YZQ5_9STRA|nr:hypothetical protein JKP88DRAFT_241258 [Tribonema minus]